MPRKNYVNVSLPSDMIGPLDKVWQGSKKSYRTRAEFVIEAVREKMDKEVQVNKKL